MDKEETIFEEMNRFIDSISDEIRSNDCDRSSIDFWLFKLKRRVKILDKSNIDDKEYVMLNALEAIANPLDYLQRQADKIDCKLDGAKAIELSNDPSYLKGFAKNALKELNLNACTHPYSHRNYKAEVTYCGKCKKVLEWQKKQ